MAHGEKQAVVALGDGYKVGELLATDIKAVTMSGVDGDPGPTTATCEGISVGDEIIAVFDATPNAQDLAVFEITDDDEVTWTGLDLNNFDTVCVFIDKTP